ncbi:MAG: tetratricopeptide repeat protein [Elusimicrobia bacterium]|nr:tetratricopeptide repeat protein [Elusimicrobiota bacterium]
MPVKCPNCGYGNEDAALSCNLCQHVLRREKPAAPAVPAAAADEFKALIDKGLKTYLTPGGQAEGLAILEKARAAIPDPPRDERDRERLARLSALLAGFRQKAAAAPAAAQAAGPAAEVRQLRQRAGEAAQRGDLAAALPCFERLVQMDPKDAESWGNKGACLHQLQRFEEALAAYQKAAELRPRDASAWLDQALCHQELKRGEEALACCDKALALTPMAPPVWYTKGSILLELLGRHEEAASCFDEVLGLNPGFHWALYKKALALDKAGQAAPALAAFGRFLHAAPPEMAAQAEAARSRVEELRQAG